MILQNVCLSRNHYLPILIEIEKQITIFIYINKNYYNMGGDHHDSHHTEQHDDHHKEHEHHSHSAADEEL